MKILRKVIPFIVVFLFLSVLIPDDAKASPDTWTFMVYMDADNNLEYYAINNFLQMSEVSSSPNVNILVQMDRINGYDSSYNDWTTCKRFDVAHGMTPVPGSAAQDIGEVDMGAPATLVSFVNWANTTHPADHNVLIIWGHGADWKGSCSDDTSGGDILTLDELYSALATIRTNMGAPLDVLGFDACSMGSVEVGYQIHEFTDYYVASESSTPLLGLSYDRTLWALVNQTIMTPLDLCNQILAGYHDYYSSMLGKPYQVWFNQSLTLSVVDTSKVAAMVAASDNLFSELQDNMKYWVNHIKAARNGTETYGGPLSSDIDLIDLYQFAENLRSTIYNDTIDSLCTDLMNSLTACVKSEMNLDNPFVTFGFGRPVGNAHGMSIYFPENATDYDSGYTSPPQSNFTHDTSWNECLSAYYIEVFKGNPTVMRPSPIGANVSLNTSVEVAFSEPMDQTSLREAFSIYPNVDGSLQWSSTNNTLSFSPSNQWIPSTNYSVTIKSNATDVGGKHMQYNYSWGFTTRLVFPGFSTILNLSGEKGENDWYVSQVNATLSTTDPDGTNWTKYMINSLPWQVYSSNITLQDEGNYTIEYYSQDVSGNDGAIEDARVKIDLTAPTSSASVSGSRVTIASSDNISGVNRTMYRIDGGTWVEYRWAFDVTGSGNHAIEYYSIDDAGNAGKSRTANVDNGLNVFEIISSYGLYIAIAIILMIVAIAIFNYISKDKGRDDA